VQNLSTFKKKTTLYFWSMLAVSSGISIETVAFTSRIFFGAADLPGMVL
jgi:hypothetical protein